MPYEQKNYDALLGTKGLSDALLKNHFTLYQGYVTNTNKVLDTLSQMGRDGKVGTPEYSEVKRRLGWEFNGMRLHEHYFNNLGGAGGMDKSGPLARKLAAEFGSYENWEKDFKGTAAMRGVGWAILYQDGDRLINVWINEHDVGHLSGCKPLLIRDVFEHAFMIDYGLKRVDYIEAFFNNINWAAVEDRFKAPVTA